MWTPQAMINDPLALILSKAKEWCYEKEFRIIGSTTGGSVKLVDGQFVPLPDEALTSIVLGCESPHHAALVKLVANMPPASRSNVWFVYRTTTNSLSRLWIRQPQRLSTITVEHSAGF